MTTAIGPQPPLMPAPPSSTTRNASNTTLAATATTSRASHHPKTLVYDFTVLDGSVATFGRLP